MQSEERGRGGTSLFLLGCQFLTRERRRVEEGNVEAGCTDFSRKGREEEKHSVGQKKLVRGRTGGRRRQKRT